MVTTPRRSIPPEAVLSSLAERRPPVAEQVRFPKENAGAVAARCDAVLGAARGR